MGRIRKRIEHTTGIILSEDNELLMLHRTDKPEQPWELPGGKKRPGETAGAAIAREILEELGVYVLHAQEIGETRFRKGHWRSPDYYSTWHVLDIGNQRPIIREPHLFDRIGSLSVTDLVTSGEAPEGLSPNLLRLRQAIMAQEVQLQTESVAS